MNFKDRVLNVVAKIPKGKVMSYKEVAKRAGNPKAYRVVGNLMAKNENKNIPCHRVIKNDYLVGGYFGSYKNSWQKTALLLKEGGVGVIPTDTIYGICGSALNKKTVEKTYELRKRKPEKPMIILVSSLNELKKFEGKPPAKTIAEAKKYFRNKIFYYNKGKIINEPSTLIDLTKKPIKILRRGKDYDKIKERQ